jgi:hypothetical protein
MKQNPSRKLGSMKKRLEDMFRLLDLWQQYVDIIYAPQANIDTLKKLKDQGRYTVDGGESVIDQDLSYAAKLKEEDIKQRLNTLFGKEELDADKVDEDLDLAYRSVLEG